MDLKELIDSLESLLYMIHNENNEDIKRNTIFKFDDFIFNNEEIIVNDEIDEMLVALAMDLEYYEPNPEWSKEDISYYGDEKFEEKIKDTLKKIDKVAKK